MTKTIFNNGVVFFDGKEMVNDFDEAQRILDMGEGTTENIDTEYAFNEREETDFIGTYAIKIDRFGDYESFLGRLRRFNAMSDSIERYSAYVPTFEEWKSGKTEKGMKLGKKLRKEGYNENILDYYSQQIKTEKEYFLTISDRVQHIAGMSYYSTGSWDGMQGSSCQNPEIGGNYALRLGGALHDDKLFIGFLHDDIEALEDLEGEMLARTIFRLINFEGKETLVATSYYGNNETKNALKIVLEKLSEVVEVYPRMKECADYSHYEEANGTFNMVHEEYYYINEYIEEEVEVDCPLCGGGGEYGLHVGEDDNYIEVDCPMCGGSGNYSVWIDEHIETEDYVEMERELTPYNEGYSHYGHEIRIDINRSMIRASREKKSERMVIETR